AIALGAPGVNAFTAQIYEDLPVVFTRDEQVFIQMEQERGKRAALWGMDHRGTREAAEVFVRDGYLDRFLTLAWHRKACGPADLLAAAPGGGHRRDVAEDHRPVFVLVAVDHLDGCFRDGRLGLHDCPAGALQHFLDVLSRLRERWDASVEIDSALTGIVRGQRERDVPRIAIEQVAQMTDSSVDVLSRVERVAHSERRRRPGHQLHQSLSSLA